jgi:Rv0078B-related antitoxin
MSSPKEKGEAQKTAERLRLALEMFGLGEDLMRQKLQREHPEASAEELEKMLRTWLQTRPGAEHGDCPGRLRVIPG